MYRPTAFAEQRPEVLREMIRDYPLATLIRLQDGQLTSDLVPLRWCADAQSASGRLQGHIARNNPLAQWPNSPNSPDDAAREVLALFHGPSAYISPNWYPGKAQTGRHVPTWNYAVIEARGVLRIVDDPHWVRDEIAALTDQQEATEPTPWSLTHAPEDFLAKLLPAIVGIEIRLSQWSGKLKMSQNQSAANRAGVVAGLHARGRELDGLVADLITRLGADQA